jgi:hypothetical protein
MNTRNRIFGSGGGIAGWGALGLLVAVASCGVKLQSPVEPPTFAARETARLRLTAAESGAGFDRISGIALHPDGLLAVTDHRNRALVFLDTAGTVIRVITAAEDRLPLVSPCCARVDSAGLVWIQSDGRYMSFDAGGDFVGSRSVPQTFRGIPPAFDGSGGQFFWTAGPPGRSIVRLTVGGDTVRTPLAPHPVIAGAPDHVVVRTPTGHEFGWPFTFGASVLTAQRHDGHYAQAVTERYEVTVYHPAGERAWHVIRDVPRPALLPAQRDSASAELSAAVSHAERVGGVLITPPAIPTEGQVLRRIWFDASGRLWVQRTSAPGDPMAFADVFDMEGRHLFVVSWPAVVRLHHGASRGRVAWGVVAAAEGGEELVRLTFQP